VNLIDLENQLHAQWLQAIEGDSRSYSQLLERIALIF